MTTDRHRFYKPLLALSAAVLLALAGFFQHQLNGQRRDPKLGLSYFTQLDTAGAPPMLTFVTVALGSFRGLIANALWIRATDLQDEGKYFEMVQLADWITKLEPTFVQVWLVQAWNMAYNISVKFTDPADRWRWVQRGIELLRDDAIRYNPTQAMVYRELAWFFQHKMGQDLDDAHRYYKTEWARQMTALFDGPRPNFAELIHPTTADERKRAELLRNKYKMDPEIMKEVDTEYGPLEWRLPEAHAIYWACVGLRNSSNSNLVFLRRVIYSSQQMSVFAGRVVRLPKNGYIITGPDLDKIGRVNANWEKLIQDEQQNKVPIERAHKNFLRTIVYMLYTHNRETEAKYWFDYVRQKYPDAIPAKDTLEEYVFQRHVEDIGTMSYDKSMTVLEGFIGDAYLAMAIDNDDRAAGMMAMALKFWNYCRDKAKGQEQRLGLPPFEDMKKDVLNRLLAPDSRLAPEFKARLRTKLNLPAPSATGTNAPAKATGTGQ